MPGLIACLLPLVVVAMSLCCVNMSVWMDPLSPDNRPEEAQFHCSLEPVVAKIESFQGQVLCL